MWKQQDLGAPALATSQTGRHTFHLQGNRKDKRLLKRELDRAQLQSFWKTGSDQTHRVQLTSPSAGQSQGTCLGKAQSGCSLSYSPRFLVLYPISPFSRKFLQR